MIRELLKNQPIQADGNERTWKIGERIIKLQRLRDTNTIIAPHLHPHHLTNATVLTKEEAQLLELNHEEKWIVSERPFVDGVPAEPTLSLAECANIAMAVRDFHEIGLPHGDIQPGNVIQTENAFTLIDVPLFQTSPGELGHVAGSAPYMAPELWRGEHPTLQSDIYALAAMLVYLVSGEPPIRSETLTEWVIAHESQTPNLTNVPEKVAPVLSRALSKSPDQRPDIQHVIDAFGEATITPIVSRDFLGNRQKAFSCSESSQTTTVVTAPKGCGLSTFLNWLRLRSQTDGFQTITLKPLEGSKTWATIDSLLQKLEAPELRWTRGDRLHLFEQFTEQVLVQLEKRENPVRVIVDDFSMFGPDMQAWFFHLAESVDERSAALQLYFGSHETIGTKPDLELNSPTADDWNRWRGDTLRTEVRDIGKGRWDQLVKHHGDSFVRMFNALSDELRIPSPVSETPRFDTASIAAIGAEWESRIIALMTSCAFGEVAKLSEHLTAMFIKTGKRPEALKVATFWTEAVIASGEPNLESLSEVLDSMADQWASLRLLVRLMHAKGQHREALSKLESPPADAPTGDVFAWRAQLSLSSGEFDNAKGIATEGLTAQGIDPSTTLRLNVARFGADAIVGETNAIEALDRISKSVDNEADPITRARAHAYRAIGLMRTGKLDDATDAHLRALEEIEAAGLAAELPTYLLNVGTAYHKQGRFGLAREYYARGIRLSNRATRPSTRGLLLANQANIDVSLGRLQEATRLVLRANEIAETHQLRALRAMCVSIRGDISLASGEIAEAVKIYTHSDSDDLKLTTHERTEFLLAQAEAFLELRDATRVADALNQARGAIEREQLDDLEHRYGMLKAQHQWLESGALGTMAGIERYRRHLLSAQEAGDHKLVLRQAPRLLQQLDNEGLTELHTEISDVLSTSRNAISMGLTRELRDDFFANLPVAPKPPVEESVVAKTAVGTSNVEPFYRMLSFNEVILTTPNLSDLLDRALEIALSLSRAERGFVLLKDEGKGRLGDFRIRASQDVDGDPIPSPHLKVSLTIAEEAASTGRTVVTVNARNDSRFNEALSVVDLDLTSVLCVPVRTGAGLLGALYLDHRFRPGVFEGDVPRMMEAYGHQLALAVENARQKDELRREQKALSDAKEELAALLQERELMVQGLQDRVAVLAESVEAERAKAHSVRDMFPEIAFSSSVMERVLDQVQRVARGDIPVVVHGESGVGKELVAKAVHDSSPRASGPFVAFNCGAVPENLIESELFGHVKGAFTGASHDRKGLFSVAAGGTIFLDELGEMPTSMQVKLLRVLQEKMVRRVGATGSEPIDVRVVAATNRDLESMVADGTFREDLYYRLAAFSIEIPPLRERREDVPLIAQTLISRIQKEVGRQGMRLSAAGARLLSQCDWPGNVRELENTLRAAIVLSDSDTLSENELAPLVTVRDAPKSKRSSATETRGRKPKASRESVVDAMRRANDDRERAARILGVSERTLYRYLQKYDLY